MLRPVCLLIVLRVTLSVFPGIALAGTGSEAPDLLHQQWVFAQLKEPSQPLPWSVAYYVNSYRNNRYQGLMLRCVEPGIVVVSFAFGRIMDTDRRAAIEVFYGFDDRGNKRRILETRNHTNAILRGETVAQFLQQLRRHQSLRVRSRSWPRGWVTFSVPLASGQPQILKLLQACQLDDDSLARMTQGNSVPDRVEARSKSHLDRLLARYWQAFDDPAKRAQIISRIESLGPSFVVLAGKIRQGSDKESPGVLEQLESYREPNGRRRAYYVKIPSDYRPDRPAGVFLFLHGGVRRPAWKARERWWPEHPALSPPGFISVYPNAWKQAYWWQPDQVENLRQILIRLRSTYNIDNNRIFLAGASDGGTGAYYFALRHNTAFAGFLIFLSVPDALSNPALNVQGQLYLPNLKNKPLLLINGAKDPLVPISRVKRFLPEFKQMGVDATSIIVPEGGHDLNWLSDYRDSIHAFLSKNLRKPYPTSLSWQTDGSGTGNRIHWLIVEEAEKSDQTGTTHFKKKEYYGPSPWIEATTSDNRIRITSTGVSRIRLLLSPDVFDFNQPLEIETNGEVRRFQPVPPSVQTLLKWYQQDDDSSMLFGRELVLQIAPASATSFQKAD